MSENSKIEWTDHTFNPWEGCTKVSPGCANCYAEARNARWGGGTATNWGKGKPRRRTTPTNWKKPFQWNRKSAQEGVRKKVFCASLADWLDDEVPIEWLTDLVILILRTPFLDWQLLTKRPQNFDDRMHEVYEQLAFKNMMQEWFAVGAWLSNDPPLNVWVGTSVEDQERANERIPLLLEIPAAKHFLSCEPLLEHTIIRPKLSAPIHGKDSIDWVIVGGESGPNCRAFNPEWARSIREECQVANTAFFMKQMGGTRKPFPPIPDDLLIRQFPNNK